MGRHDVLEVGLGVRAGAIDVIPVAGVVFLESYLNTTGTRHFFANANEPVALHPELTDETDYPSREAGSCRPFVWDEENVRPVWHRLAERAAALGQPVPNPDVTTDPDGDIGRKGERLRPLSSENGLYTFLLPGGTKEVSLVSRAGKLTDTRPWLEDRRCFGVYVERILLHGSGGIGQIPLDHPQLSQGWWAVERYGSVLRRWTDGNAVVLLPALDAPTVLEIRASRGGMAYDTHAERQRAVAVSRFRQALPRRGPRGISAGGERRGTISSAQFIVINVPANSRIIAGILLAAYRFLL